MLQSKPDFWCLRQSHADIVQQASRGILQVGVLDLRWGSSWESLSGQVFETDPPARPCGNIVKNLGARAQSGSLSIMGSAHPCHGPGRRGEKSSLHTTFSQAHEKDANVPIILQWINAKISFHRSP